MRMFQNRINTIKKVNGTWAHSSAEIVDAFLDFYHNLLGTRNKTRHVEAAIIVMGKILTETQ